MNFVGKPTYNLVRLIPVSESIITYVRFQGSTSAVKSSCCSSFGIFFNFTPYTASSLYHMCRNRIMETYWCCKKNSIVDNYLKPDFNPALVPCIKEKCPKWNEWKDRGGCILLVKEAKNGRR
jgi:hypothetical protein